MAAPSLLATTAAGIWIPSIIDRISRLLPRNEVACSLRVVDKATVAMLRMPEFMTVRLSEPVPHHAFTWRWGCPGAMRELTFRGRRKVLRLTAASGATTNLAFAARAARCRLTYDVVYAAGKAGQPGSCALLEGLGCDMGGALHGAAAGGHLSLWEELMAGWTGAKRSPLLDIREAARAGHAQVLERMVQRYREHAPLRPRSDGVWDLVCAVAEGCDLATLRRFFVELLDPDGDWDDLELWEGDDELWIEEARVMMVEAAARSHTPDWRAKLEWLESRGFPQTWEAFTSAAERPDALERFAWLAQRGYPRRPEVDGDDDGYAASLRAAAATGNSAAILFLADGMPADVKFALVWGAAARQGHLHVLQALHAAGRCVGACGAARVAARSGHLHVLAWLVEAPDLGVQLDEELFHAAATSGSVELLAWLHERGCPWDSTSFRGAVISGCEAALEWLAERGCPMPDDGFPFAYAVREEDFATLECLRRLGCPWGRTGHVFNECCEAHNGNRIAMLSWLLASGCPIDWPAAVERATMAVTEAAAQVAKDPTSVHWTTQLEEHQATHAWACAEVRRHRQG
ncbi:hypothetical protein GPECTOR_113g291 [Gonium pectorale]|uniref:Ankyrin repeat domain-containing protein n=1 Tax=Gonium pectorale TaxID=33097 RepID=A0A150FZ65_GONPE|nr:hypothetical protein GPECTOR_113g291 [Gonium pectorale]|eukprot:KXZ42879.1 hypothetical protein GPECTOR_113g291 [Gonium pectorale]